jgi:glycosyltransferase involved in cell wall biosynthesis
MNKPIKPELSIVATIYNGEAVIPSLVQRIIKAVSTMDISFDILLVDDGSTDNSAFILESEALANSNVQVLILSRNFGQQIAMSAGVAHARGKHVLIMDGDLQNPPEAIPELYAKALEGYDVVYTTARVRNNWIDQLTSWLFWRFLNQIANMQVVRNQLMLRIMSERVVEHYKRYPERIRTVAAISHDIGMKTSVMEVKNERRVAGKSNYSTLKRLNLAIDVIFDFSNHPLNVLFYAGLVIMLATGLLGLAYLYSYLTYDVMPGFTTLVLLVMFFGSSNLITLGLLARYIANIYTEVKQRPLFIVRQHINLPQD